MNESAHGPAPRLAGLINGLSFVLPNNCRRNKPTCRRTWWRRRAKIAADSPACRRRSSGAAPSGDEHGDVGEDQQFGAQCFDRFPGSGVARQAARQQGHHRQSKAQQRGFRGVRRAARRLPAARAVGTIQFPPPAPLTIARAATTQSPRCGSSRVIQKLRQLPGAAPPRQQATPAPTAQEPSAAAGIEGEQTHQGSNENRHRIVASPASMYRPNGDKRSRTTDIADDTDRNSIRSWPGKGGIV